jgi:hypothetical protein
MAQESELKTKIQKIATLVEQIESSGDPHSRALAKDLLESIMALHGAGLERILDIAANSGDAGQNIVQLCARDEVVSSVLLLYGLHPNDLPTRVERALETARKFLEPRAAQAELISVEGSQVRVRLHQKPNGCGSGASLQSMLEAAIQDAAPDAVAIAIEESVASLPGFIPIAQLQSGQSLSDSRTENRSVRSGD